MSKLNKLKKQTAIILSCAIASNVMFIGAAPKAKAAIDPDHALNDSLNELEQTVIDYIFLKNYIAKNITINGDLKVSLDYNKDGTVNVLDLNRAKQKLISLSSSQTTTTTTAAPVSTSPVTTTTTTTPVTTTTVTTTPVPATTKPVTTTPAPGGLKVGDTVTYSGKAYAYASGDGNTVNVSGKFVITDILPNENLPYRVQLKNTGWVSYSDVMKENPQITTVSTVPTSVVKAVLKVGDTVKYNGKAYYYATGEGKNVDVSGSFKVSDILTDKKYTYRVQLENVGWVAYEDIMKLNPQVLDTTLAAATTPKVTTAPSVKAVKAGDKVKFAGKAYYTAAGGTSVEINGTYEVESVAAGADYKYTVQLKNTGWVSYNEVVTQNPLLYSGQTVTTTSTAPAVTTTPKVTTAPVKITFKVGDKVKYTGKAYYNADGGSSVDISGTYEVSSVLTGTDHKYTVQLKAAGWVSCEELEKANQSTVTTTTTAATPKVTTAPAKITFKVGDKVKYTGKAYYNADGGSSVDISGTYEVSSVLTGTDHKYTVQLKAAGWVSCEELEKANQSTVTTTTTAATPKVTTAPAKITFKVGDKVKYTGKAYYTADGGNSVDVSGTYEVSSVLTGTADHKYTVQLKAAGWVSCEELEKANQSSVTTTTTTTTPAASAVPAKITFKAGDKVKYSGKAYYTANGGSSVDVSGTYEVSEVLTGAGYKYTVQLKGAGWVSYEELEKANQSTVTVPANTDIKTLDGKTFRIKNSASGKYITVDSGSDKDRTNVYQKSLASDKSQMFTLKLYGTSDCFRLFACCSSSGRVLDIVKDSKEQLASGCNVQIYNSVDPSAQTWDIINAGNGRFKILANSSSKLAMTAFGTGDGSQAGKAGTSDGNIFLSDYSGSENQLWILEEVK